MIKNYLLLSALALAFFAFTPAMAEEEYTETPAEELIHSTEDMDSEATEEFEEKVDCAEAAMNGEELPAECVSTTEGDMSDSDMEVTE